MSGDKLRKLVSCVHLVDIRTMSIEGRIDLDAGISDGVDGEAELPLSL